MHYKKTIFIGLCLCLPITGFAQNEKLREVIYQIIKGRDMQVGVAIIRNGQDTLTINNEKQYPLMSVFKLHQAISVAHYLQQEGLPLDAQIYINKTDLHPNTHSPLRENFPQGDFYISVRKLLRYTLLWSDNNACDILFRYSGGPSFTDKYIRSLGINDFSIKATEAEMHQNLEVCYTNWTTPLAAAQVVEKLFSTGEDRLPYQDFILQALIACETGEERLPRPTIGSSAIIGHKTGTGDRNAAGKIIGLNDIGFVLMPDGSRYTVAVFIKDSGESMENTTKVIGDIAEAIFRYFSFLPDNQR